jgi:hypothetical protein
LGLGILERAGLGAHGLAKVGAHLGIERIRLGQAPEGFREVAHLAGVDHHDR